MARHLPVHGHAFPLLPTADTLIADGGRGMVVRLPQVHDTRRFGRITQHIHLARKWGRVAYVGEGKNRLPAVHVSDAIRVYRMALEKGRAGTRYHAVGEEGVALRDFAEVIGAGLKMPVESITAEEAPEYFGWLARLVTMDLSASSALRANSWTGTLPGRTYSPTCAKWMTPRPRVSP